jgi:thiamine-phosphate pyrophosphorylase
LDNRLARAKLARAASRLNARCGLPALILLTDDERLADPLSAARALPKGAMVIIRARQLAHRAHLAEALAPIAHARDLILLIADDPALAIRVRAHGVHFPEAHGGRASYWRARRPGWLITSSAHSLWACARAHYADAILLGPVFATRSHLHGATLGPIRTRMIARSVAKPVYALGGIDSRTVTQLENAQLAGVAAIGALASPSP